MLTTQEIKTFLDEDMASPLKKRAEVGQRYYEGKHDILEYRLFYFNADGKLVEDKTRTNTKIPHPYFTELVDQGVQFILSGGDIFKSDDERLQAELDRYFNKNKRFMVELSETITGMQAKGFDYMYAYKDKDRLTFENADCLGVLEVEGRFSSDKKDYRIYKYLDRIDKEGKTQWKILVVDDENTYFYKQEGNGDIQKDTSVELNPRPHAIYKDKKGKLYKKEGYKLMPFFRLDNNKKRKSLLESVKALIDDYDLMASSLSNNLVDFDTPIHVVKGYHSTDLTELQQNLKTKKVIGVDEEGGIEVHTVEIPYQARQAKLDLDEKNIYKFGMGLNMAGLKDTSATTNIAIKAAYSLLELRCAKIIDQLELFLQELTEPVLAEINEREGTNYTMDNVYFEFAPEIMSNAQENAAIELTEAQRKQAEINTLKSLETVLDNETFMKLVCEQLDIDYEEIKSKLPDPNEAENAVLDAQGALNNVPVEGEVIEEV